MKTLIVHCDTQDDAETLRRTTLAQRTRPQWPEVAVHPTYLKRLFDDGTRKLPYLKDVLAASIHSTPADFIILTNADICFSPSFANTFMYATATSNCVIAKRRDFRRKLDSPLSEDEIKTGEQYPGIDLFIFTPQWWMEHGHEMPDMVMGAEAWDLCLQVLMRLHGQPIEMMDAIYHEHHDSFWSRPENIGTLPSQLHNLECARYFLSDKPEQLALLIPNRPC